MKAQNRVAAAVVAGLMAMAVSGPVQAAPQADGLAWATARHLNVRTLGRSVRSTYEKPCLLVVSNECQWQSAMAQLAASGSLETGALPAPDVDWRGQSVVVVAMGKVPYGYNLEVTNAGRNSSELLLTVRVDYNSYENTLDDVSPVHMLVVDAKGLNHAVAQYSLALPGLCSSAKAPSCGSVRQLSDGAAVAADDGGPSEASLTWGGLKSMYR